MPSSCWTPPEFTSLGQMKSPEIGTLLKVDTPHTTALALVSALSAPAPSTRAPIRNSGSPKWSSSANCRRRLGRRTEAARTPGFRRGISAYPALGDVVGRASQSELARAYSCDLTKAIRIGHIHQDASIPAMAKLDELLGKHFAVLGTTGTGKSCVVALILRRILESNPRPTSFCSTSTANMPRASAKAPRSSPRTTSTCRSGFSTSRRSWRS
jgi:uncharacterized protein